MSWWEEVCGCNLAWIFHIKGLVSFKRYEYHSFLTCYLFSVDNGFLFVVWCCPYRSSTLLLIRLAQIFSAQVASVEASLTFLSDWTNLHNLLAYGLNCFIRMDLNGWVTRFWCFLFSAIAVSNLALEWSHNFKKNIIRPSFVCDSSLSFKSAGIILLSNVYDGLYVCIYIEGQSPLRAFAIISGVN